MDQQQIGQAIRKRRKALKVKQADLAEIAETSRRTLSKIERGEANPTVETLIKVLQVLGLEIELVVKGYHE